MFIWKVFFSFRRHSLEGARLCWRFKHFFGLFCFFSLSIVLTLFRFQCSHCYHKKITRIEKKTCSRSLKMRMLYGGIDIYFKQRVPCSAHKVPVIRDFQRLFFAIFSKLSFMYGRKSGMGYGILAPYVVDLWCCVYMSSMPQFLRLFYPQIIVQTYINGSLFSPWLSMELLYRKLDFLWFYAKLRFTYAVETRVRPVFLG